MSTYPDNRPPLLPTVYGPSYNPWLLRLPILFIIGLLLVLLVLVVFVTAFQLRYTDKIVPGVSAYGVDLSGLTHAQAVTMLAGKFTYDREAVFTFRDGDRFWQISAGELGVAFDVEETVSQAFAAGHTGSVLRDLLSQANIWLNGRSIAPIIKYDQTIAVQRLNEIAQRINRAPVNATLTINGGVVKTTPSQTGRALDIAATLSRLDGILLNMTTGAEIPLVVREAPPVIWDAEAAAARARAALSGALTLLADDQSGGMLGPWVASVEQIAALLDVSLIDNQDGTLSYDVRVKMGAFRGFLDQLAPGLIAAPQDGRFRFNTSTGQLDIMRPSINGRALDIDETLKRLEEGVFNPTNRTVMMAFDYTLPRYHNAIDAASLGIRELVGESTTYFTGSTVTRRTNIIEAASRFDGVIIGPGEEFSFNRILGDISPETGFERAKIILGDRTIDGVGGGVCQVSTTIFRAAFAGGFPIIERHSHGYRVGYYEIGGPPGLDAAIYQPTTDFRFQNDTPYHMLIETSIFPGSDAIQFRLYSTNPGRKVIIQTPVITDLRAPLNTIYEPNPTLQLGQSLQVDWAAEGAYVSVVRIIQDLNGNEINRLDLRTQYQPWAAVVQVAPDDPRLNTG